MSLFSNSTSCVSLASHQPAQRQECILRRRRPPLPLPPPLPPRHHYHHRHHLLSHAVRHDATPDLRHGRAARHHRHHVLSSDAPVRASARATAESHQPHTGHRSHRLRTAAAAKLPTRLHLAAPSTAAAAAATSLQTAGDHRSHRPRTAAVAAAATLRLWLRAAVAAALLQDCIDHHTFAVFPHLPQVTIPDAPVPSLYLASVAV